jgi:hypothetical protein
LGEDIFLLFALMEFPMTRKKGTGYFFSSLAWRRLYGEKTVRKAERARFVSEGEESEALIRVAFDTLGQKQRVLEPYSLSLSSMVAADIPQNLGLNNHA